MSVEPAEPPVFKSRRNANAITVDIKGLPAIHSLEAEQALLGAMISEPDQVIDKALEAGLQPSDFFLESHQEIFKALRDMRNTSNPDVYIDPSTLHQYLLDHKLSDTVGGISKLAELSAGVVSVLTAATHIKTVREKSLLRRLQASCAEIVYNIHDRPHQAQDLVDEAESKIFKLAETGASTGVTESASAVKSALDLIIKTQQIREKGTYQGIPTGFDELDKLTTGLQGGQMVVIAARPGVGKTALALSMARNFIRERWSDEENRFVRPGYPVGIFSLEMTSQQLMLRMLAAHASLSLQKIREGKLSESEVAFLGSVAEEMSNMPLYIDESPMLSVSQLRARARRLRQMYGIDVIIIDYLQLLTSTSDKARDNRQVEVAEISRGIKALAMELDVPIIVLAQLNRKPEEGNAEPALHHLRESGSIEQDADVVMLLSRVESKEGEELHGHGHPIRARLNVAKQRNGPTDRLDLIFQAAYTRYESPPRESK